MTKTIAQLGDDLAVRYLDEHGYVVLERNTGGQAGEIDIVARIGNVYHFFQVKTKSVESLKEVSSMEKYLPEQKQGHVQTALDAYVRTHNVETWQLDVIAVFIDIKDKKARVEILKKRAVDN